jgi:hypothetical protein
MLEIDLLRMFLRPDTLRRLAHRDLVLVEAKEGALR